MSSQIILVFVDWQPMICICAWKCQDSAMIQHPSSLEMHCAKCIRQHSCCFGWSNSACFYYEHHFEAFNGVRCAVQYKERTPNNWVELCVSQCGLLSVGSKHHLLSPRPLPLPPDIKRQNLCAGRASRHGGGAEITKIQLLSSLRLESFRVQDIAICVL